MSKDTRCYHFRYAGLDFYWKGTYVESNGVYSGIFLRYNHLKLMVQIPKSHYTQQSDGEERNHSESRPGLARYTSSIDPEMAGILGIFESVASLLQDYIPFDDYVEPVELEKTGDSNRLRSICEVSLATAMCMVIGEYQKRLWVKGVFSVGLWAQLWAKPPMLGISFFFRYRLKNPVEPEPLYSHDTRFVTGSTMNCHYFCIVVALAFMTPALNY